MNDLGRSNSDGPQLRTLLLTDLVDSTGLVERLGDTPASELFREHDRLVLRLQQEWRGRLIDRSDGLLLLFERPIDGLGFALDYTRGLADLGRSRNLELQARAGLHVGEVLTWKNSEAAVQVGAKPLEVEGLAKPMAARLMSLARPGQVLLSAVAESLTRRAARELGQRGENLLWKSHGRWRFKGVPEPIEVYEVGEVGIAPLRAPTNMPKVWRDVPLWRRPAALAAELLLVAVIATGAWFMTRPQPAIAFAERDWVVVGDLRNLTGQTAMDDSLAQAFRISLEQSRYVNVLSDLKARDTLSRMQRAPGTPLDRAVASEIALRDGARAVILPTVSEIGGRVRFSAEVVDPSTQTTVYADSADGVGASSTLDSIDQVTATLRGRLGEALASIRKDSAPLPQVTTANLDALRAYALGQNAYGVGKFKQALGFYERAVSLDRNFALAHMGVLRANNAMLDLPRGIPSLRTAFALRDRLPPRDQVYLDAWIAQVDAPEQAYEKWMQMSNLYPEYFPAANNVGYALEVRNRYAEALPYAARAASPKYEFAPLSAELLGRMRLALGQYAKADEAFAMAVKSDLPSGRIWRAASWAAQRRFAEAERAWPADKDLPPGYFERVSIYLDQGKWDAAIDEARRVLAVVPAGSDRSRAGLYPLAVAQWSKGDHGAALATVQRMADESLAALKTAESATSARDEASLAAYAALLAQRMGDTNVAEGVVSTLKASEAAIRMPPVDPMVQVLDARALLAKGQAAQAAEALARLLDGSEPFQARVALEEAFTAAGQPERALEQARWLAAHRGRAYSEYGCQWCQQGLNVVDTQRAVRRVAALQAARSHHDGARALAAAPGGVADQRLRRTLSDGTFK